MAINLTVILKSKPENSALVKSLLLELVEKSTQEAACKQYDLHQNCDDFNTFIFHEIWENQKGLDNHNEQSYIQSFFEKAKTLLQETPIVFRTEKLA
ncbi:putative quinol monooxygenase [Flavobacterium xinjiangense]|uniref:Quinol monooxygenase YgiN n=1 Tax=Flavobacterium xinjiangense TaxID=178356 RepID=A0A1M7L6J1_9FLAO|nr:putative quinol monooxygenase [Flavobacterium xinjiangense]SHM72959.1 Quinol monooxygenase YgiN [Flavobacterium xinjiangense]